MRDPVRILVKKAESTLEGTKQFYIAVEKEDWKGSGVETTRFSIDREGNSGGQNEPWIQPNLALGGPQKGYSKRIHFTRLIQTDFWQEYYATPSHSHHLRAAKFFHGTHKRFAQKDFLIFMRP